MWIIGLVSPDLSHLWVLPCILGTGIFHIYYYCVSYPFYCIGFCSLCTNDILLSHRLIHLVLFHPPAVFSGNRFTAGGRSYILLVCCACLFIDCMCCIFEENKLKPKLKLNYQILTPKNLSDFFPNSVFGFISEKKECWRNLVAYLWEATSKKSENAGGQYS